LQGQAVGRFDGETEQAGEDCSRGLDAIFFSFDLIFELFPAILLS